MWLFAWLVGWLDSKPKMNQVPRGQLNDNFFKKHLSPVFRASGGTTERSWNHQQVISGQPEPHLPLLAQLPKTYPASPPFTPVTPCCISPPRLKQGQIVGLGLSWLCLRCQHSLRVGRVVGFSHVCEKESQWAYIPWLQIALSYRFTLI